MRDKYVHYQHILREGSQVAYYLANLAIDKRNFTFTSFQHPELKEGN